LSFISVFAEETPILFFTLLRLYFSRGQRPSGTALIVIRQLLTLAERSSGLCQRLCYWSGLGLRLKLRLKWTLKLWSTLEHYRSTPHDSRFDLTYNFLLSTLTAKSPWTQSE